MLLHEPFLIGNDGPADIGTMLQNADKLLASCSHADHAAALKKQGWIAKDNTDFAAAAVAKEAFKGLLSHFGLETILPGTLAGELSFLKFQGTPLAAPPRRV